MLILGDRVREVWLDEHTRALIIPLETGKTVLSMDFYYRDWNFPVDDEISVDGSSLIYYRPSTLSPELSRLGVYKVEVIGHATEELRETISIRVWVSRPDLTDEEVAEIHRILTRSILSGAL